MVDKAAAGAVNLFNLDGPTATGSGLLRAAASFTAQTTRGLSAGFDLQARFEGAVDAKLTDAVKASLSGSASVSVGAEASAYFPLDIFDFAGVTATLKAQAEARADISLSVELRPYELVAGVLADNSGSLWLPYVEVVASQIAARAGLYASAAVCVKATAETKAGIRLFAKSNEPAGTVFVVNFGYGFIYGYSWGLIAELSFPEPSAIVRGVLGVTARQLAAAFDAESGKHPEPARSALAEAAELVELVVPALGGVLCSLLADSSEADRQQQLTTAVTGLAAQLGQHLLERLLAAALDGLGAFLGQLGLPAGAEVTNALRALLTGIEDAVVAGRGAVAMLPDAIDAVVDVLLDTARLGLTDVDSELLRDIVIGIWASVSLLASDPGLSRAPTGGVRRLLMDEGIDPAVGQPGDLPARALGRSAARLLDRAGAATWLTNVTGLVIEDLLRMPLRGLSEDPVTFLRDFLTAVGASLSGELLDELPLDEVGVPPEAVESVRTILQIGVQELPSLLDNPSDEAVLRRLRERVSVGLLQGLGRPLILFLEKLANEGFTRAVPAIRQLETEARDVGDLIPQFPPGGPLERFTSALEDLGRESLDATLGVPTSILLGHLASKLDRWRTERLPVELALLHKTVGLEGETSASLLAALDTPNTAVVLNALVALVEHHLDQIRSITQFLVEDSADLLGRLTTLPFEQAARTFAASVVFSFELTAAMIAELSAIAADLDHQISELQNTAASKAADIALQCGQLADAAAQAANQVVEKIITDLVGNDPVAQFAASVALNALTGGLMPVVSRVLGDLSTVLRAAGESIAAAARAGTLGEGGALSLLQEAVRGTTAQGVTIPITLLVPVFPPFFFAEVTVATVTVPAEWLGRALWGAITTLTGVGPILAAIDDTAKSLQLTSSALDAVRAAGTPDQVRQQAANLNSQVSASVLGQQITIDFDAGNAQSVVTVTSDATVITGRVSGVDRSYVMPISVGSGASSTAIPARVQFTCQGVAVPPEAVTWSDAGPGILAFRFGVSTRGVSSSAGVVVRPGVCMVTGLAAMGAWGGKSDTTGASRALTLLLVPDPAQQGRHVVLEGWAEQDGATRIAYISGDAVGGGRLTLFTQQQDGTSATEDLTEAAGAAPPSVGSGLTAWSDDAGDVHVVYCAADGGLRALHRDAAGAVSEEVLDDGAGRSFVRTGRPVRFTADVEQVAYVTEYGALRLATRATADGNWQAVDLTSLAGAPPALPATGLVGWQAEVPVGDFESEGNLLRNPLFADRALGRREHAAAGAVRIPARPGQDILTDRQPSTLPMAGAGSMLHVSTLIATGVLVQAFAAPRTGPERVESVAWVYVLRGEVGIGTGDHGRTGVDARTAERGRWIRLAAPNGVSPANEFVISATSPGGAEFYIGAAAVREPGAVTRRAQACHLVYGGADGHLYWLTEQPSAPAWQVSDLTGLAGALPWWRDTDLATWPGTDGQQHLTFWAVNGQLYELVGPDAAAGWAATAMPEPAAPFGPSMLRRRRSAAATGWAAAGIAGLAVTGQAGPLQVGTSDGTPGNWRWADTAVVPASRGALAGWGTPTGTAGIAVIGGSRLPAQAGLPDRGTGFPLYLVSGTGDPDLWTTTDLVREASAPWPAGPGGER
jgi:hypothetical protein